METAEEVCVIGGGEVYALALPMATHLHLTHVDTVVEGADAFFPQFDSKDWRVVSRESHAIDDKHALAFAFVDYERALSSL
jgi:dihydrofolate reductase